MTLPLMKHSSTPGKYIFTLWFTFLTAMAGIGAYYRMFTEFGSYDDEGTLMIAVKQYLGGVKLYDQNALPYGPVYYFYNWAVRMLSGTTVTHDVVRISSLLPWLLTALVAAWIVFRFTGSLVLASGTHLLTSLTLSDFFHNEPGHPQELCILLLVCLVASGIVASLPRWRILGLILLGTLTTALLLVKVNIGAFAFLAGSLAILAHSPKTKLSRVASYAGAAASVLLPVVLMKPHLQDEPTRMFAVLVVLSMIAALLILFRIPRTICFRSRDSWISFVAFAITFVGVILALKVQGINLNAMLHALVLNSLATYVTRGVWYIALPAEHGWLPWILGGLAAALFFSRGTLNGERRIEDVLYLKLAFVIFPLVALYFGMQPFKLVLPFCWLVLYGRPENASVSVTFPRTLLCVLTILQALYAYPIAGSQVSFIQVLPIIVIMTCLGDLLLWKQERLRVIPPLLIRAGSLGLLLWVAASYLSVARSERKFYNSLPPLQIRGAERIHLYPVQARDYSWLAQNLNNHCDLFVSFPELPSLHIWTEKNPLPGLDVDNWMMTSSDQQQIAAAKVLSQHPNACAIYDPDLVTFWNRAHQNLEALPLVRYLRDNFKVVGATGQFYFLVRNERDLNIASPAIKVPFNPSEINEAWKSNGCLGIGCSH
jgi:hypothetical protein